MTKFVSALIATTLSTTFAAGAMAADLDMNIFTLDNEATVTLTSNGQGVANYPVVIQGEQYLTSENGTVSIVNHDSVPHVYKFVAKDSQGNLIQHRRYLTTDN